MEGILEFIKEKKTLCGLLLLGIFSVTFFTLYVVEVTAEEVFTCPKLALDEEKNEEENEEEEVVVDIKGAVANPGVYRVQKKAIIQDVITLAGGITKDADTTNLNLSKKVSNEMVITVFTKSEMKAQEFVKEPIKDSATSDNKVSSESSKVSLNHASLEELETLPGIGEAKAKIIIEYREKCGDFTSIEELKNIKGIGEKVYEKLESYITV